ncbi:MAG: hypothetical protein QXW91_00875 [Candidatus Nitrosotenuis sp.]
MRSSRKNKIEYPDEMTCDQMGRYKTFRIFQDAKKAWTYAKKTDGQIYTQVDGDIDVVYSKGIHYVNKTGIYAVIK